jgi:iron complex transport system ATP-binding protein
MLKVRNLRFSYSGGPPVFENISFEISAGNLCALFGPNGSGKTTLFKCCLKLLACTAGRIFLDGRNVEDIPVREMAKLIAYVPQEHKPSFPYLVRDVVLMGRTPHMGGVFGVSRRDKAKSHDALRICGISDLTYRPYNQLSGGQRQLVMISRAVAQETPLIFLDEPTSALDFSNQIKVWHLLKKISENGTTVVACTHDPNHVLWFCSDVIVMGLDGLVAHGPPSRVLTNGTMDQVYERMCNVLNMNGTRVVLPRQWDGSGNELSQPGEPWEKG